VGQRPGRSDGARGSRRSGSGRRARCRQRTGGSSRTGVTAADPVLARPDLSGVGGEMAIGGLEPLRWISQITSSEKGSLLDAAQSYTQRTASMFASTSCAPGLCSLPAAALARARCPGTSMLSIWLEAIASERSSCWAMVLTPTVSACGWRRGRRPAHRSQPAGPRRRARTIVRPARPHQGRIGTVRHKPQA